MFNHRIQLVGLALFGLIFTALDEWALAQVAPPLPGAEQMLPDPEVLEQGPIHEAFAEPLAFEKEVPEVVAKQPPEPVQEIPPEERPEGRNVEWIPGYFEFDRDRNDFVWVSGLWRDVPPGRTWVPGEWQGVDGGWQWVHGFWADAKQEQQEMRLLPVPPNSLEAGPSSPAPGDNYLWAPGNWNWQNTGYAWQAGFWYQAQPNWLWVPNHYCYTPRGSIFVSGYWDFLPQARGWLYAPVYWGGGFAGFGGSYSYRPGSLINVNLLFSNLFVNRGYGHYYYGYNRGGHPGWLQPWGVNYGNWGLHNGLHGHHAGYDPLWAHHHWQNRSNNHGGGNNGNHQNGLGNLANRPGVHNGKLVTNFDDFKRQHGNQLKVHHLNDSEIGKARSQASKYAHFDRGRIGFDGKTGKNIGGHHAGAHAKSLGNSTVQGPILRHGSNAAHQGNQGGRGNVGSQSLADRNINAGIGRNQHSGNFLGQENSSSHRTHSLSNRTHIPNTGVPSNSGVVQSRPGYAVRPRSDLSRKSQFDALRQSQQSQMNSNLSQWLGGNRQSSPIAQSQSSRRESFYRGLSQQGAVGRSTTGPGSIGRGSIPQGPIQSQPRPQYRPDTRSGLHSLPQFSRPQVNLPRDSGPSVSQPRSFQERGPRIQQSVPQATAQFRPGWPKCVSRKR